MVSSCKRILLVLLSFVLCLGNARAQNAGALADTAFKQGKYADAAQLYDLAASTESDADKRANYYTSAKNSRNCARYIAEAADLYDTALLNDAEVDYKAAKSRCQSVLKYNKNDKEARRILDLCDEKLAFYAAAKAEEELWARVISDSTITAYNEYKYDALSKRLMILDFINKMDNYRKYLNDCITKSIKTYDNKPNKLRYTYKNIIYNVQFKSIVYITKEPDSKKCLIYTNENRVLPYSGTIVQLYKELDDRFIKTSRSTIINKDFISLYDCKENKIEFETGQIITDISRSNRKRVMEHVRNN